jgi:CRP/FNR family transcriptional regulator, cyclic AMP receptor protein
MNPPNKFLSLTAKKPTSDRSEFWREVANRIRPSEPGTSKPSGAPHSSVMEVGLSPITPLNDAPPRTLNNSAIVRSSPLPPSVRAMFEQREFGRQYDAAQADLDAIALDLPGLECPQDDVQFLASDHSFDDLSLSVDCLLQHRKRLLAPSLDLRRPRKNVLVLGAGPGGLMTGIQLSLRDHRVIVCEQREAYARNRYIGVYKEVTHLMAALGMPESMTYDFSQYRGKRGIMLADIQTFLHGVALKLGVIIYTGAVPRALSLPVLRIGEVELQRATRAASSAPTQSSVGIVRWQHDTVSRVRSGVAIRFDTIVEATGGRSGLREILVGKENIVSIRSIGKAAAARDPSLKSFFDDPEDHCAEYVESGYGCPPGLRELFAKALLSDREGEIPDELPCFVSNIDASIFIKPMQATPHSLGLASRIGDRDLEIPHDWVVLECRLPDQNLSRYHIEGPLPQTFEFGGKQLLTREALDKLNPVTLLFRILYAMGVPFDAVDRRRLVEFHDSENSYGDTSDIVSTWIGGFRGLRLGGEKPIWCGNVPGSDTVEYAIVGEALQNAWYRFGVGVDDTFAAAVRFAEGVDLSPDPRLAEAARFEKVMISRSVQVLYHLFEVARNTSQGVVGPVLTEYHMDAQHSFDLADARLRDIARRGAEILASENDIRSTHSDSLLEAALEHELESCFFTFLTLLESFAYPPELLARTRQMMKIGCADRRSSTFAALEGALSPQHRELLSSVLQAAKSESPNEADDARRREERLVELGLGRYAWVSPWIRACALRSLDPSSAAAISVLKRAAKDPNPLLAETAGATLRAANEGRPAVSMSERYRTIDKVVVLQNVSLFRAIPHEILAGIATLLTERWTEPGERIFEKGELGDCLYVIESGQVRVQDGDRILGHLGQHEFFGELSLLDAEPRSASVFAAERSHLFRLAQSDFYSLISERPDITQAINRALCQMVRKANAA